MNKERKNICVTQKAIVLRNDGKFLTIKRGKTAPSHPLMWDLPGGELNYGEDPFAGIVREIKEEVALDVSNVKPFDVFGHENPWGYWVTIAYTCESLSGKVTLSMEHMEFQWVTKEEFFKLSSWEKITRFVKNYIFK